MHDSIDFITSRYDALTRSERKIADFVIANLQDAIEMSVRDFSLKTGVSEATAIRFCRRLGFEGYRDFCLKMAQGITSQVDYVMDMQGNADDLEERVSRVLLASAETIRSTLDGMDYQLLERVAQLISECRSLLLIGMGTSHTVCQDAMLRFLRIGKQAACYSDPHASIVAISHFGEQDVVIGISHSGTTQEVFEALRMARERGARTVGITTYPSERISDVSDIVLRTFTRESPLHKVAITSRTSQLAVIDALFIAVMADNSNEALTNVMRVSENITRMERFEFPKRSNHNGDKG